MTAYYNEFDKNAAEWLRNLINAGLIAPGIVDERSIEDVRPDDLDGFTQCHFFAGIGGWSYALRLAGWADHRPAWTASCPCQPYSAAGEGGGFADERHLWPHFEHLLRNQKRRPAVVLGEQVASKFAEPWVDLVHADLEALDYAFGCIPFPSASVGAPHIRDRLYWLAHAESQWAGREFGELGTSEGNRIREVSGQRFGLAEFEHLRATGRMDYANNPRLERLGFGHQAARGRDGTLRPVAPPSQFSGLADAYGWDACAEGLQRGGQYGQQPQDGGRTVVASGGRAVARGNDFVRQLGGGGRPGPTNGFWLDADWLACRDGKWRPVEPGAFPLAHGVPGRMGRLRAYGNAINVQQAAIFIQSAMSVLD